MKAVVHSSVPLILDASAAIAYLLSEPGCEKIEQLLIDHPEAHAPYHWHAEVGNVLLGQLKKDALTENELIELNPELTFSIGSQQTHYQSSLALAAAAKKHGLTAYDVGYLILAIDLKGILCTLDTALIQAAKKAGVTVATF
jgi:predicted nucleic acid-binding protein